METTTLMSDTALNQDETANRPGALATAALRAVDAGLRALQRLRSRLEPAVVEEDAATARGRRKQPVSEEAPAPAVPAPTAKSFLHRALIVLMCLLIGGVSGMLFSYRAFSRQLEAQQKRIDYLQDEDRLARKNETRNLGAKLKQQEEIAECRQSLSEVEQEVEGYQRQIAELKPQLPSTPSVGRPKSRNEVAAKALTAQPHIPQKTGTCVTGTGNPSGDLLDCISKFNRP